VEVSGIIAGIDAQIQKLQEARRVLESVSVPAVASKVTRGRPKGSKTAATKTATPTPSKRKLSPEGRKRIADAMKRRWAERRKTVAKAATVKAAPVKTATKTAAK
jgi:hypothetical protein